MVVDIGVVVNGVGLCDDFVFDEDWFEGEDIG